MENDSKFKYHLRRSTSNVQDLVYTFEKQFLANRWILMVDIVLFITMNYGDRSQIIHVKVESYRIDPYTATLALVALSYMCLAAPPQGPQWTKGVTFILQLYPREKLLFSYN